MLEVRVGSMAEPGPSAGDWIRNHKLDRVYLDLDPDPEPALIWTIDQAGNRGHSPCEPPST